MSTSMSKAEPNMLLRRNVKPGNVTLVKISDDYSNRLLERVKSKNFRHGHVRSGGPYEIRNHQN